MKKLTKALSAMLSAAVIFSTAVMSVSALDPPDEGTYIGWEYHDNGCNTDETYLREIDGVMYVFDKATGYAKDRYGDHVSCKRALFCRIAIIYW